MSDIEEDTVNDIRSKLKKDKQMFSKMYDTLKEIFPSFNDKDKDRDKNIPESEIIELIKDYIKTKTKDKYEKMNSIQNIFLNSFEQAKRFRLGYNRGLKELITYWDNYPTFINDLDKKLDNLKVAEKKYNSANSKFKDDYNNREILQLKNDYKNKLNEIKKNLLNYESNRLKDNQYDLLHIISNELDYHSKLAKLYINSFNQIKETNILLDLEDFKKKYPMTKNVELTKSLIGVDLDVLKDNESSKINEKKEEEKKKSKKVYDDEDEEILNE